MTAWLSDLQAQQRKVFHLRGLPTRREEAWKYTDMAAFEKTFKLLDKLPAQNTLTEAELFLQTLPQLAAPCVKLIFNNGAFVRTVQDNAVLPEGVKIGSLQHFLAEDEDKIKPFLLRELDAANFPFAVFNLANFVDGLVVFVPKNTVLTQPIHVVFAATEDNSRAVIRNIIIAEEGSKVSIIEEYVGSAKQYFTNVVTHIDSQRSAVVNHHKIQAEQDTAAHIANTFITQAQHSTVNYFNLSLGSLLARDDVHVLQDKTGAACHLNGFYRLNHDGQHIDHHLHVDHAAEHGVSTMQYKGILDKKSRAVFNGKVFVHKNAQHINAKQANHNLLLSPQAEVNTKPELEIYADDVKCAHGATVGQLDADALFYLRARGIDKQQALRLLTQAFAEEVLETLNDPEIKSYLEQRAGRYDN